MDIRKIDSEAAFAAVAALNGTRRAITGLLTTKAHAGATSVVTTGHWQAPSGVALQVTAANATNLATLRTLCRNLWAVGRLHFADALNHVGADGTNTWSNQPAEDAVLTDLQTWLNAAKAAFNAHRTQASVHFTNDATNTITSADATDQSSADTLANELKTDLNAHITFALAGDCIRLVG